MESQKVRIESDSEPGKFYEVDTIALTCTCPYHNRKLRMLALDDPHRLCKHLIKVFADRGVPDIFKAYQKDIKWFAEHNASFTSPGKALSHEKEQTLQRAKHYYLTPDQIVVFSRNKKRKYLYIEAKAIERPISARMKLQDGDASLQISNLYASYSFVRNRCSFPDPYRFMAPAIILWLDIEYADLTGCKRVRSDENILAMYNQMSNPRQEIPIGAIVTISRGKPGQQDMIEWGEWTEEQFNCNFVNAHVDVKDEDGIHEPTEIEAIISLSDNFLLFRINLSSCVKLFFQETGQKLIFSTSYEGKGYTLTTDHEFPKRFSYIKRAILAWLEEEVRRARDHSFDHLLEKE